MKILKQIPSAKVAEFVPPAYRTLLTTRRFGKGLVTILLFPSDRDDVVSSGVVKKALRRLENLVDQKIIAVGGCFTLESKELLNHKQIETFALSDFHWTDQTYQNIRQGSRPLRH